MAASTYRVFLSHSSKDKDFVEEVYRRLTRDGVACFFDSESIDWGDNWVRKLELALVECSDIVFVLSPDFCNSKWVEIERTSSMASGSAKLRPLLLHECRDLPHFPLFLRQVQTIDVSTTSLFEQNYPRICRALGGEPGEDFALGDKQSLPPVHPLPARHSMPYAPLGDKFIGRAGALWELYHSLFRDSTTVVQGTGVVAGTGGLGKTQLAIEYAHRFGPAYQGGVYWVQADLGKTEMISRISQAAGVEVDTKAEEGEQLAQIWRGLNSRGLPCLVILDNFPENAALRPFLPNTGHVHTIVTTRRQDLDGATVRLPFLTVEQGVQLLNSGARQFGQDAQALAERLGGLPLALELAKSYLNYRTDLSVAELIEEMQRAGEMEILSEFAAEYRNELPSRHERDVAATFQLSWNVAGDGAKQILRVMGELAPVPVPLKFLRTVLNISEQASFRDVLRKGVGELARLSLVELSGGDPVAHRLVLAFARHRNAVDAASPFARCLEVLAGQMNRAFNNPGGETNRELDLLLPHAEFLTSLGRVSGDQLADLLNPVGMHHQSMGRFEAARQSFSRALDCYEASFEPGHPLIARSQSNLALVLQDLGQWEEARDLLRKALSSDEQSFEVGHPSIAIRQSNLALVLQDLGQWEEARDLLRKALASNEQSFEVGHPSIAISQSNLATVLQDLGQLEEARDLLRKALASDQQSFEAGHPSIARSQLNLATVLQGLGQLEEARDLLRKAHSAMLARFGAEHPNTKTIKATLEVLMNKRHASGA